MNRENIIKYCLEFSNTYEDYPFKDDNISATIKHISNNKWFAQIVEEGSHEDLIDKRGEYYSLVNM